MKIVAKSKFDQNIYDKVLKGANAIELHLDDDFIKNPMMWNEQIIKDVPIIAVHAPLIEGKNDTNIEVFSNRQTLVKTCEFAKKIANTQGHRVTIICHLGTSPELLKKLGVYESLVFFVRDLANAYEDLDFAIENVVPLESGVYEHVALRAVEWNSSPKFVKDVAHPRVGTCLDTCHALMMIRFFECLSKYIDKRYDEYEDFIRFGLESFFMENKDTIKWMHLAYTKTHGWGEDHGLPFTHLDAGYLKHILWLYDKYEYSCPISLEVQEDNYSNALNFACTRNTLITCAREMLGEDIEII